MRRAALERARAHLRKVVSEHRRRGEARLPTVTVLAAQAMVSRNVLLRALDDVSSTEGLTRRPGSGIRIGPSCVSAVSAREPSKPRWQLIAEAVDRDVELGLYPPGSPVPTAKELRIRYGGCYRTLRRALLELQQRRVVVRRGANCVFPSPAPEHSSGSVLLVAAGQSDGSITFAGQRSTELYRSLCSIVSRHRVGFVPYSYFSWDDELFDTVDKRVTTWKQIAARRTVLGAIFWNAGMPRPENYVRMIRRLLRLGRPVAVIDEVGEADYGREFAGTMRPLVISLATGPLCGQVMGRYLVARGHRRVAYISHHHALRWSEHRLTGLQQSVGSTATPLQVVPAVSTELDYFVPHMQAHTERYTSSLSRPVEHLVRQVRKTFTDAAHAEDELRRALAGMVNADVTWNMLWPLFERAMGDHGVTAWVCANDKTAVAALSFLRKHNKRIAVAGFDDSIDAFLANVTSYNFDLQGVAHAAVRHVLFPAARERGGEALRTVEAEGFVVQRESA